MRSSYMANAERIGLAVACCLWCGCARPARPASLNASPSREAVAARNSVAEFAHLRSVYAHCQTYQDRGTVVLKMWTRDGSVFTVVNRFDTIFVRDRGFRFRYLDEDGMLIVSIWNWDGRAVKVWFSTSSEVDASKVEAQMWDISDITNFTSWFVPSLLFGRDMHLGDGPSFVGTGCLWCLEVAFRAPEQDVTDLRLDLRASVVRRIDEVDAHPRANDSEEFFPGTAGSPLVRIETLVLYDAPSFDADESVLIAEMQKGPPPPARPASK